MYINGKRAAWLASAKWSIGSQTDTSKATGQSTFEYGPEMEQLLADLTNEGYGAGSYQAAPRPEAGGNQGPSIPGVPPPQAQPNYGPQSVGGGAGGGAAGPSGGGGGPSMQMQGTGGGGMYGAQNLSQTTTADGRYSKPNPNSPGYQQMANQVKPGSTLAMNNQTGQLEVIPRQTATWMNTNQAAPSGTIGGQYGLGSGGGTYAFQSQTQAPTNPGGGFAMEGANEGGGFGTQSAQAASALVPRMPITQVDPRNRDPIELGPRTPTPPGGLPGNPPIGGFPGNPGEPGTPTTPNPREPDPPGSRPGASSFWGYGGASGNRQLAGSDLYETFSDQLQNPEIDANVKNAIEQEAMNATRANYAGQMGQLSRRSAATGNSGGLAAAFSQAGRNQAGDLGMQARQNKIAFEQEAQRRREGAQKGIAGLYAGESAYNQALLGMRGELAGKVRKGTTRQVTDVEKPISEF